MTIQQLQSRLTSLFKTTSTASHLHKFIRAFQRITSEIVYDCSLPMYQLSRGFGFLWVHRVDRSACRPALCGQQTVTAEDIEAEVKNVSLRRVSLTNTIRRRRGARVTATSVWIFLLTYILSCMQLRSPQSADTEYTTIISQVLISIYTVSQN